MIKKVSISVCDNCDTVSFAPEYTPCPNCGRIMVVAIFVRTPPQVVLEAPDDTTGAFDDSIIGSY